MTVWVFFPDFFSQKMLFLEIFFGKKLLPEYLCTLQKKENV